MNKYAYGISLLSNVGMQQIYPMRSTLINSSALAVYGIHNPSVSVMTFDKF